MAVRRRNLTAEEEGLWRRVAASVNPLQRRTLVPAVEAPLLQSVLKQSAPTDQASKRAAEPGYSGQPVTAPPPAAGAAESLLPGLDKRTTQRLRRGKLPVEGRLDLHGMTQVQAHAALQRFINASRAMNRRLVLVITGKGWDPMAKRPEEAMGVLRRSVPRWLATPPLNQYVAAVSDAHVKDGGSGALYVLLRRKRLSKPRT